MADVGMIVCPPGVQNGLLCNIKDLAGTGVDVAGNAALDGMAASFVQGWANLLRQTSLLWLGSGGAEASGDAVAGVIASLRADVSWLVTGMAVVSVLVCAIRLALTRRSDPAVDAARGLAALVLAGGVGVPTVLALWRAGDAWSAWIVGKSIDGDLGERVAAMANGVTAGGLGLGAGAVILVAGLGIVAAVGLVVVMAARVAVIVVLAALLPVVAASSGTRTGQQALGRVLAYLGAWLLFKPVAATFTAAGFLLVGNGASLTASLSGLALIVMSLAALPALVKLLSPASAAVTSSGGGMGTAGLVVATGARTIARRP